MWSCKVGVAELNADQIALSGITDAYGKGVEHSERVKGCTRIVTSMLRTWSGACSCVSSAWVILTELQG